MKNRRSFNPTGKIYVRDSSGVIELPELPPKQIDLFIDWFTGQGYSLRSLQMSSNESKIRYIRKFLEQTNPKDLQLELQL